MKRYKIYHSARFDSELIKYNKNFQYIVDKIENHLVENPYAGSPLGFEWLREKRFGKYRIYYLIYDEMEAVFMVAISEKKNQQKVINTIKILIDFFKEEIHNIVNKKFLFNSSYFSIFNVIKTFNKLF